MIKMSFMFLVHTQIYYQWNTNDATIMELLLSSFIQDVMTEQLVNKY